MRKIKGKAMALKNLIDHQKGAVVSKTLIQKDTGTITIFSFDKGEGLSEHTAPFDAFVFILEGEAQIKIGDETHRLSGGEMIIMPANVPHALNAFSPFKMLLVMIKG